MPTACGEEGREEGDDGGERGRDPSAIMACRMGGDVSHAWSMRRVQRSESKLPDSWWAVEVQKLLKESSSWSEAKREREGERGRRDIGLVGL